MTPSGQPESPVSGSCVSPTYALRRDMFVELLNSHGFRGKFDLVYMPIDFKTSQPIGYAFVNAVDPDSALHLFRVFEGFRSWPAKSPKTCSVSWGGRQGLQSNVRVYRNLAVMKQSAPEAWKPALFLQGDMVRFPAPTRRLKRSHKQHGTIGSNVAGSWSSPAEMDGDGSSRLDQ
ncbi:unnamed protein product [Prorocentrum cordatum]|uniref:Mei2-like C-terminal RNA recognition motif domain-containing protein n=1 Tax=Prorocentrum cordatum TaxID=2364126 RepID=A0ABN9TQ21_9DINO|nr:unnamed protein product [Polarella glacialis]